MFTSEFFARNGRLPMLALVMTVALAGCESKQDKAIDQAKQQAVATGQPQQVVTVDKTGTTTTTVVQPPAHDLRPEPGMPTAGTRAGRS